MCSSRATALRRLPPRAVFVAFAVTVVLTALGAPDVTCVPMDPHGDGHAGPAGTPVPLTPVTFVVGVEGPDGQNQSDEDEMLVCDLAGATPAFSAVPTPYRTGYSKLPCRLSATRVLTTGGGENHRFSRREEQSALTDDDEVVFLIDRIGSENTVTVIPAGNFDDHGSAQIAALSCDSAALLGTGPDNIHATADDTILLLTDLGSGNTVTALPAPFARDTSSRVVALSPTTMLMGARGPDATEATEDDVVYVFRDVGTGNLRTTIETPYRVPTRAGMALRVSDSSAVVCTHGPDGVESTADDLVLLLTELDGPVPSVTPITVGPIVGRGGGQPLLLNEDTLVVASVGPDLNAETGDDEIVIVSGLGTTNAVSSVTIGGLAENAVSHPARLSDTVCVLGTAGPDGRFQYPAKDFGLDDEVVILSDVGGTNTVTRVPVAGLGEGSASEIAVLTADAFLVSSGGPDGYSLTGDDDCVVLVTGVGTTPTTQLLDVVGGIDAWGRASQPQVLGGGRAAMTTAGVGNRPEMDGDDQIAILDGLPGPGVRGLATQRIRLRFRAGKPDKPTKIQAKGMLLLDGRLLDGALTISIGNAAQTIPADAFVPNKKGILKYSDKKRLSGWISKVSYDPATGKIAVVGKGTGTGAETTAAEYVPFAVEDANHVYLSDAVAGTAKRRGIKYRDR